MNTPQSAQKNSTQLQSATQEQGEMDTSQMLSDTLSLLKQAADNLRGNLDEEQVQLYQLAMAESEIQGAAAFLELAQDSGTLVQELAACYAADKCVGTLERFRRSPAAFGVSRDDLFPDWACSRWTDPATATQLGEQLIAQGLPEVPLDNAHSIVRSTFADFGRQVVEPLAESIHRENLLVPESLLTQLSEMGCFGLSIPESYGGLNPDEAEDTVGMVVVTEELSKASLGAAGSLITRPEIMARAVLDGGSQAQRARWLPKIASGEKLCAISVTEPNTGSDVANVALKASRTEGGWLINGGKTWCTFAGRADYILLLARTDSEASPPHKGLSLFVVEKPVERGESFVYEQPQGGRVEGRAIATLGYRGMHSFEMFYDNFFVPDENLIGEDAGQGKGFYFTMRGFMGGRIQTAARACGLMRAAFEKSLEYTTQRMVFGQSVADYPLTQEKVCRMASAILANQAHTLRVAHMIDAGEGTMEASMVKLAACRAAEWVTREAVQLFGGMGYAEETPVSRYFADARVLSIFEGAEETLAIRVVGKALVTRSN